MELCPTGLSERAQSYLDQVADSGEITTDVAVALQLYGDRAAIDRVLDPGRRAAGHHARLAVSDELCGMGLAILEELPDPRREALLMIGVLGAFNSALGLARYLAMSVFEDEIWGGCQLPFRNRPRLDGRERPTKGVARLLRARAFICRQVKVCPEVVRMRDEVGHLVNRLPLEFAGFPDTMSVMADLDRQRALVRLNRHATNEDLDVDALLRKIKEISTGPRMVRRARAAFRRGRRRQRAVIRRAAAFAAGLLGVSAVGAFARGEGVVLRGSAFHLRVRAARPLEAKGHGCLDVQVVDSGPVGAALASLCVYHVETPTLDQLSALALFMGAGLERDVLATANVVQVHNAGAAHPLIVERRAAQQGARRRDRYQQRQEQAERYWEANSETWKAAVLVYVFGNRLSFLRKFIDQDENSYAPGYDMPIPEEAA